MFITSPPKTRLWVEFVFQEDYFCRRRIEKACGPCRADPCDDRITAERSYYINFGINPAAQVVQNNAHSALKIREGQ